VDARSVSNCLRFLSHLWVTYPPTRLHRFSSDACFFQVTLKYPEDCWGIYLDRWRQVGLPSATGMLFLVLRSLCLVQEDSKWQKTSLPRAGNSSDGAIEIHGAPETAPPSIRYNFILPKWAEVLLLLMTFYRAQTSPRSKCAKSAVAQSRTSYPRTGTFSVVSWNLAKGDTARLLWISSVISCHFMSWPNLGFDRMGNSAIRSVDLENLP